MRHADVVAGSAFRMAVFAGLLFSLALLSVGISTYHLVRSALLEELEVQLVKELSLLRHTHEEGGPGALADAVGQLENPAIAGDRFAALYDGSGKKLAGNINADAAPNKLIARRTMIVVQNAADERLFARSVIIENTKVVIGRNTHLLDETLAALMRALMAAGIAALAGSLLLGWLLSRRSLQQLERIALTLEQVAKGDTDARVLAGEGKGQIDRISRLIDASLERLSALMQSTQNTTRAIAHDLRSPLNSAFILVREASESPVNRQQLLRDAEAALYNLGAIFDTVLRISRLEASTDRSAFSAVDLREVIADVVAVFEPAFTELGQTAVIKSVSSPVTVFADEQMLKQLLTNLLQNFNRHTPAGSTVTIAVCRLGTGGATLRVADNGPGIPAAACEDMLKPFRRLDASRSEEGSGLGLALARAIAIRHGAAINLSNNHPGLRVDVRFPPPPSNLSNL